MDDNDYRDGRMLYNIVLGKLKNILNVENEGKELSNKLKGLLPETLIQDLCFKTDSYLVYDKDCYVIKGFDIGFGHVEDLYEYMDSFGDLYPKTIIKHSIINFFKKKSFFPYIRKIHIEKTRKKLNCIICSKEYAPQTFKTCSYCGERFIRNGECPPYEEGNYCELDEFDESMDEKDILCKDCIQKYI